MLIQRLDATITRFLTAGNRAALPTGGAIVFVGRIAASAEGGGIWPRRKTGSGQQENCGVLIGSAVKGDRPCAIICWGHGNSLWFL